MLLSGLAFVADHMVVAPTADWLLLPANDSEEHADEEKEQTAGYC